ncbi:MAG: Glu/Leu/Phe/Val dehydrogenase dimerization domain-containing protein [Janthinobacterium lividum]
MITGAGDLDERKCSLVGLPYGGAKGWVACAPLSLSLRELDVVSRDCVAWVIGRPQLDHVVSLLRDADVLRTSELQHSV